MSRVVFVRSPYNYDADQASRDSGLTCLDESLTVEDEAKETDINEIVRRFGLTGELPTNVRPPVFGDFTQVTDFRTALHAVAAAEESFMQMTAEVRRRFNNDPQEFVEFCSKPGNEEEMRKLGLLVEKKEEGGGSPPPPPSTGGT